MSPCSPTSSATRTISATWTSRWPAPATGVTALQMDIKITSITEEIMRRRWPRRATAACTSWARWRRRSTGAREAISGNAPRITIINIPKDKIREVIGSGGKVIREIIETTGAKIDIEDDGTIKVAAVDASAAQAAIDWIRGIVAEPEVGGIYTGKVVKIVDFGAFVNFLGSRDGLVHISELAPQRVGKVADVVKVGDAVKVKVLGVDDRGKVKLSMKAGRSSDRRGPDQAAFGGGSGRAGRVLTRRRPPAPHDPTSGTLMTHALSGDRPSWRRRPCAGEHAGRHQGGGRARRRLASSSTSS